MRFYVLFNSISVKSGRREDDNERLCAMESRLRLRRFNKTCGDKTDIVKFVQRCNKGFSDADKSRGDRLKTGRFSCTTSGKNVTLV